MAWHAASSYPPGPGRPLRDCASSGSTSRRGAASRLEDEVSACREELLTLRDCLAEVGVVSHARFLKRLHRRHFNAVRAAHGFESDLELRDVFSMPGLALAVAVALGVSGTCAASLSSLALWHSLQGLVGAVLSWNPVGVFVCGGYNDQQRLCSAERFCPRAGAWEPLRPMSARRHGAAAAAVDGVLYVCGGRDGGQLWTSVERYEPARGVWEEVAPMSLARAYAAAGAVNGRLYVCGGSDTGLLGFRSVERLSPREGRWEELPAMLEARQYPAVCAVAGALYVCGGASGLMHTPLCSVELLDPSIGLWRAAPPMSERRRGAAAAAVGAWLFVCGGTHNAVLASVECLRTHDLVWEAAPAMSVERHCAVAATVAGKLYVFGGCSADNQFLSSCESFDPGLAAWSPQPPMLEGRGNAVAVAIAAGG